eukprot:3072138-Rhodomonas_salina.1
MRCLVLGCALCEAESGPVPGSGATRCVLLTSAMLLRTRYAVCGTHSLCSMLLCRVRYCLTLCCYARAVQVAVMPNAKPLRTRSTQCAVLTYAMLLPVRH